ncbi:MAG: universal stress protein [Chloroflexi bacterium]|nr:universal stress protein [Chloroflexota bacterium]
MRVLCAIGQRGGPELIRRLAAIVGSHAECLLLHVIDVGPRHELEKHLRGPLRHRPPHEPEREATFQAAEEAAGQAALQEALAAAQQAGFIAGTTVKRGKAEKIIVEMAREIGVSLIVISAREGAAGHPRLGPASVGHIARFVLDHAPCDVLLLRQEA